MWLRRVDNLMIITCLIIVKVTVFQLLRCLLACTRIGETKQRSIPAVDYGFTKSGNISFLTLITRDFDHDNTEYECDTDEVECDTIMANCNIEISIWKGNKNQ